MISQKKRERILVILRAPDIDSAIYTKISFCRENGWKCSQETTDLKILLPNEDMNFLKFVLRTYNNFKDFKLFDKDGVEIK